ncbi:MAG: hypothetical protein K0S41_1409 [Anaerocolumna sp.]|jgi:hypothetical protein|nr:hypothetical protein [Anaerocolumna sp.]
MAVEYVDIPVEDIGIFLNKDSDKRFMKAMVKYFVDNKLSYKIKSCANEMYRINLFIKKSKEAMIINVNESTSGSMHIHLRIKNPSVFEKLGDYTKNVRNSILNGKTCKAPYCCNCNSEYVFTYKETEYRKCHMLCDNFQIRNLDIDDYQNLFTIIQDEIKFGKPKGRKS